MSNICDALKILMPNGKAFNFPYGLDIQKLHLALCKEPERLVIYGDAIRDAGNPGTIPDDFICEWEAFLGLRCDSTLTMEQRHQRIIGRYVSVGGQAKDYVKNVLNQAGFDVYVYENIPSEGQKTYTCLMGDKYLGDALCGEFSDRIDPRTIPDGTLIVGSPDYTLEKVYVATMGGAYLGDTVMGGLGDFQGARLIETVYSIPADSTRYIFFWFIAGSNGYFDTVDLPIERKNDFVELILKIKPAHTWCVANINWI